MWFIFPQIAGLGTSPTSRKYAISSLKEARYYLAHPVLGPRLEECVLLLTDLRGRTADDVFGPLDAMKLRSSLTLFARASTGSPHFETALSRYFAGVTDSGTDARLAPDAPGLVA
jgi:uncharacterized protein (DUF1810 family)